jgi:hypothetical protein
MCRRWSSNVLSIELQPAKSFSRRDRFPVFQVLNISNISAPPPPPPTVKLLFLCLLFFATDLGTSCHSGLFCGRHYYQFKLSVSSRISRFILLNPWINRIVLLFCSFNRCAILAVLTVQTPSSRPSLTYFRYVTPFAGVTAKGITASMQDTVIAWRRFDDPWEWGSDVKLNWAVATGASNVTLSCAVWAKVTPM